MIPLEDTFADVIGKAQRGMHISDADLAKRAEVSEAELRAVKAGQPVDAVIRRVARHLRLDPSALEDLAHRRWYPAQPLFKHGFAMFNTRMGDMTVNSYLVWDGKTRDAAAFDTGADCGEMLDVAAAEKLRIRWIFLTHTHDDHVADLARLAAATAAEVWSSEREPAQFPGAQTFRDHAHFHIGSLPVKTYPTGGHSPGQTTYVVMGLTHTLAIVGDALFAGSAGGSEDHFDDQLRLDRTHILSQTRDTVLACGHGPLTTVADEKRHNPFFAYNRKDPEPKVRETTQT